MPRLPIDIYASGENSQVPCRRPEQERGRAVGSALAKSQRSGHGVQEEEEEAASLFSAGPCVEGAPCTGGCLPGKMDIEQLS